jgi:hypothetical protein
MRSLILTAFLALASVIHAQAARIDIDDPALLGPVLVSIDVNGGDLEQIVTEVRFDAGIYSYIYAVQSSPYFPSGFGQNEGEAALVSFAVTGRPLGQTWGAIDTNDSIWGGFGNPTEIVESISPIDDGFIAIRENASGSAIFAVVYWQSPLPPAFNGRLTYTGRNYCYSKPFCYEDGIYHEDGGSYRYDVDSFDTTVFAPVPEPASILMVAAGLAGLAQTVRRRKRKLGG